MSISPVTKRHALGQLVLCQGCCCGRVDRGFPPVPVERLKEVWKREKLNQTIQLTVSGCLGPCDVANVVLVMCEGESHWFGKIATEATYDALIGWARRCHAMGRLLPLPEAVRNYRFERFAHGGFARPACQDEALMAGRQDEVHYGS